MINSDKGDVLVNIVLSIMVIVIILTVMFYALSGENGMINKIIEGDSDNEQSDSTEVVQINKNSSEDIVINK